MDNTSQLNIKLEKELHTNFTSEARAFNWIFRNWSLETYLRVRCFDLSDHDHLDNGELACSVAQLIGGCTNESDDEIEFWTALGWPDDWPDLREIKRFVLAAQWLCDGVTGAHQFELEDTLNTEAKVAAEIQEDAEMEALDEKMSLALDALGDEANEVGEYAIGEDGVLHVELWDGTRRIVTADGILRFPAGGGGMQ